MDRRWTRLAASLLIVGSFDPSSAQLAAGASQAQTDFQLTEVEPYYTRYKALLACVRTMASNTGGSPADQAKLILALCQEKASDLKAVLGSRIGLARANKVISLFQDKLYDSLKQQRDAADQAKLSPDERLAKVSLWSSGPWHVLRLKGQCVAIHRFEGATTFGGFSYAGGTLQDILIGEEDGRVKIMLFTPSAGHAHDLVPLVGKTIKLVMLARPLDGSKEQVLQTSSQVKQDGDTYYLDYANLSGAENTLTKFGNMSVASIDGHDKTNLSGYSYDLRGLQDAIAAYKKCTP